MTGTEPIALLAGGDSSVLARINPVTRFAAAMILTFPLFITLDWMSATVVAVIEVAIWLLTRQGHVRALARRCVPFLVASPLAGASMALYGSPGGEIFWSWGLMTVSEQSISYGLAVSARIIALGMAVIVTLTGIDPTDMADGLAQVGHLPVRFVLGTLAGVRLIGHLGADWRSVRLARRARGLGDSGALRRWATTAFTLLVSAIRRGSTLATAMEARGFGTGPRTWARPSRLGLPDLICVLAALLIVVVGLLIALVSGHFRWIGSVM